VPLQDAKWLRLANRLTSPMSPSSRAATEGPIPLSCCSLLPVAAIRVGQGRVGLFDLLVDHREFGDQLRGELTAGPADHITRTHGGESTTM